MKGGWGGEEFVLVEVVVVEDVMRLISICLNGRTYFLWHLSLMAVEANVFNADGRLFGIVNKWILRVCF